MEKKNVQEIMDVIKKARGSAIKFWLHFTTSEQVHLYNRIASLAEKAEVTKTKMCMAILEYGVSFFEDEIDDIVSADKDTTP